MLPAIVRFGIAQTQFYLPIKFYLPDKLPECGFGAILSGFGVYQASERII
jgi:hypothetical protein